MVYYIGKYICKKHYLKLVINPKNNPKHLQFLNKVIVLSDKLLKARLLLIIKYKY